MNETKRSLVIFERQAPVLDHFIGEAAAWQEVTKAWISLSPPPASTQAGEFIGAAQTTSQRKLIAKLYFTPATDAITTDCRMKLAKLIPVNEANANDDANYRIFNIDQIVNVGEQNRELEMLVVERT